MLLGAGLSRLYHELLGAPWFKLEQIEITGLKNLDRFEILNTMGLKRGQCTLNIGVVQVAERLEKAPGGQAGPRQVRIARAYRGGNS